MNKEQAELLKGLTEDEKLTVEERKAIMALMIDFNLSSKLMAPLVRWGQHYGAQIGCVSGDNVIERIHFLACAMVSEPFDSILNAVAKEVDEANMILGMPYPTFMAKNNAIRFIRAFQLAVVKTRTPEKPKLDGVIH